MCKKYACSSFVFLLFVFGLSLGTFSKAIAGVGPSVSDVTSRMELVREIKAFEARLGWKPTTNFERYDESLATYDYCAWTGKLDLNFSWHEMTEEECKAAEQGYDTVFFQFEAVAGIDTPLSRSMVSADLSRFIMVVFHEDYHEQLMEIPSRSLNESAAMLVGLLAAREFAREKYGENSEISHLLAADVWLFLMNARIEKRYYEELESLYVRVGRGEVDHAEGMQQKSELFKKMWSECKNMRLATAASCAHITNNASFANNIAYATHYPLFYDLHACLGRDTKKTGLVIARLAAENLSEEEFIRKVNAAIERDCRP